MIKIQAINLFLYIPEDPAFSTGVAHFFKYLFLLVKASSNLESYNLFNREMDEDSISVLKDMLILNVSK